MWLTDDSNVRAISRIPRLLRGEGAQSFQHARLPFFFPTGSNVRQQLETGDGPQRLHEGLPLILELGCSQTEARSDTDKNPPSKPEALSENLQHARDPCPSFSHYPQILSGNPRPLATSFVGRVDYWC
jgi:hypothetical protein